MAHGYPVSFLAIDNFTKYMWVIPLENKSGPELIRAMKEIIKHMGKPKKLYSDQEPAMVNTVEFLKFLTDNKILHIATRGHANTAERAPCRKSTTAAMIGSSASTRHSTSQPPVALLVLGGLAAASLSQRAAERTAGTNAAPRTPPEPQRRRPKRAMCVLTGFVNE